MPKSFALFCDKYPDLSLLLAIENKSAALLGSQNLPLPQDCDVLYLIGLHCPTPLLEKIQSRSYKKVVLLFLTLSELEQWLYYEEAALLLENDSVHITVYFEGLSKEKFVDSLVMGNPIQTIEVLFPLAEDKEKLALAKELKHLLFERSFYFLNGYKEVLFSDILLKNYCANLSLAKKSFSLQPLKGAFSHYPVVICGAGPSLDLHLETLKTLEDKAILIAAGSAIATLSTAGIQPHFLMAIDPNPLEWLRLKNHAFTDVPFLYSLRVHHEVPPLFQGPHAVIRSLGLEWMDPFESALIDGMQEITQAMDEKSCSVITLAASFACYLGACRVVLCGVDLGFQGESPYSSHVEHTQDHLHLKSLEERIFEEKGVKESLVKSPLKWRSEARALSSFIQKQPIPFFNAGSGIVIEGAAPLLLQEEVQTWETKGNLRERIKERITSKKCAFDEKNLQKHLEDFSSSLDKTVSLMEAIVSVLDAGHDRAREEIELFLIEEELKEELFYRTFLLPQAVSLKLLKKEKSLFSKEILEELFIKIKRVKETLGSNSAYCVESSR